MNDKIRKITVDGEGESMWEQSLNSELLHRML